MKQKIEKYPADEHQRSFRIVFGQMQDNFEFGTTLKHLHKSEQKVLFYEGTSRGIGEQSSKSKSGSTLKIDIRSQSMN